MNRLLLLVLIPALAVQRTPPMRTVPATAEVLVMTTASIPWYTGTAINPLLRAAHLAMTGRHVTLYLPWIEPGEQKKMQYPEIFESKLEQSRYVLNWVQKEAKLPVDEKLKIAFYDGKYHAPHNSIYPMGETLEYVETVERYGLNSEEVTASTKEWLPEVVVLEEPEHLNWYAHRAGWRSAWRRFPNVVGVVHTNYPTYARTEGSGLPLLGFLLDPLLIGPFKSLFTLGISKWMCRAHCHEVVKLSNALPRNLGGGRSDVVENVHGVRSVFLNLGDAKAQSSPFFSTKNDSFDSLIAHGPEHLTPGAYFVGKMLWPKGLDKLATLLKKTKRRYGGSLPSEFHLIGDGPDLPAIRRKFERLKIPVDFKGRQDHAKAAKSYRVLINPSVTEVLCTTVAEAIAMGKWVIVKRHPSNEFFYQFPTCLPFTSFDDFSRAYSHALHHEPPPLSRGLRHTLTWEAATSRFCKAATADHPVPFGNKVAAFVHCQFGRGLFGDVLRTISGGGFRLGFQAAYVARKKRRERRQQRKTEAAEAATRAANTTTTEDSETPSSTANETQQTAEEEEKMPKKKKKTT